MTGFPYSRNFNYIIVIFFVYEMIHDIRAFDHLIIVCIIPVQNSYLSCCTAYNFAVMRFQLFFKSCIML